jgi:hypothetical protein
MSSEAIVVANGIALLRGGASLIVPGVPPAAAAVGYYTKTWDTTVLGSTTGTWQAFDFYGVVPDADYASQNGDGSIFLPGNDASGYGATICSAVHQGSDNPNWTGATFGGGAYFEMIATFTGQGTGPYNNGGPAFWALDVEHTSQSSDYTVTWSTAGSVPWNSGTAYTVGACVSSGGNFYFCIANNTNEEPPNATYWLISTSYNDFFEVDFMEYDCGTEYSYQNGIGNHYGSGQGTANPVMEWDSVAGSILVPSGTDFTQQHKYGCLWVPATATSQGYLKFYFDDVQVGTTFVWNQYSALTLPPPVNNSTAMAGMDNRHMMLIMGTGTDQPMTVYRTAVWQPSAANNLVI